MLWVAVTVNVFQAGLMHVLVSVFGAVGVGVGVFVLDVVMLVCGVCMGVGDLAVPVFVRVWCVMGVVLGHRCPLLV